MRKYSRVGFFRYRWMVVKWAVTIAGILVGAAVLGPWQLRMLSISSGTAAITLANSYNTLRLSFSVVSSLQLILLIFIVTVSVRKPWSKRLSRQIEVEIAEPKTLNSVCS